MREDIEAFFKEYKGRVQITNKEITDFFYKYHNYEITNPNQRYLFRQQLGCFLNYVSQKTVGIDWDKVKKYNKK